MTLTYLPSILDRLADNSYAHNSLELHRQSIAKLENQLAAPELLEGDRQALVNELRQQRLSFTLLQNTLGSLQGIRDCVKRDLAWLLNATNLCSAELLESYPEVTTSVLNYGLPDLAGKTASSLETLKLESMLEKVIRTFEPRILSDSLKVKLIHDPTAQSHNALVFEINGWLWSEPTPLRLQLTTQLDLESGDMKVID
ncbi:type VI secretion system baseplate subunit TssE [Thiolinea disciformis]|uniref:type VI secretion system baseplate subunit TssE n=1 Tax=Thiolinea disciformis TaxID=125614 RepID=UPI000380FAF0|nr:type VI secretion system baseplate subunit TssE [Thiolinea disciformis]